MFVEDYMTTNVHTVASDARVAVVCELFSKHGVRHLPVRDDAGRVVGIVSKSDIRAAVGYDSAQDVSLTVSEIMSVEPRTIAPDAALEVALGVFCESKVGALPVMRRGELVGILTRHDILWAFYSVLGLNEPGTRIEVALPDLKVDLAAAFTALRDCQEDIISAVVARMRRDGGEPALYLRVAGTDPRPVERRLRDAAVIVLQPEHA